MTRLALSILAAMAIGCDTPTGDDDTTGGDTEDAVAVLGSCTYINTFGGGEECKEYIGAGWTPADAEADCAAPFIGADPGTFVVDAACDYPAVLGRCLLDEGGELQVDLVFPGDDAADCGGVQVGCGFGQGTFVPSEICDEGGPVDGPTTGGVFQPFEQVCAEPMPGEDMGTGPDGDVCTWQAISACTEEGREYVDYASCDPVISQRPYAPFNLGIETSDDDPRLDDTAFMAELEWVTDQVESCACICCHSDVESPDGPSGWYVEAPGIWTDLLDDDGMAMMAGWVNSEAFGAFPSEDNNGFDRSVTGTPTTDIPRMLAFFEGELARRGFSRDDFTDTPPFGGPLYDQIVYEPSPCTNGEGVAPDGTITWTGAGARYVYILEADAASPGVPPNLDLPDGTIWRLDVAPGDTPVGDGFVYGTPPSGTTQVFPESGGPADLVDGETYYLYVLLDIYQPLTRCTFTYAD